MKRNISLRDLLDGNSSKSSNSLSTKNIKPDVPSDEDSNMSSLESINLSYYQSSPMMKSSQIKSIVSKSIGDKSVQSFLMKKKVAATLDNVGNSENQPIDLDNEAHSGILDGTEANFKQLLEPKRLPELPNAKKTKLRDLFGGPRRSYDSDPDKSSGISLQNPLMHHNKLNRLNPISKLKSLNAPLPEIQLIEPKDDFDLTKQNIILNLAKLNSKEYISSFRFSMTDYKSLNTIPADKSDTETSLIVLENMSDNSTLYKDTHILWSELFRPTSIKEVLLEPKLKENVSTWINISFEKLKRQTSRNQLLKTQRNEDKHIDNFIIYDSFEEEEEDPNVLEEFIPLMILHGEAVGKNTLLKVIMDSLEGQIYEINTTNNRGKKDILCHLKEFSTTHQVKAKGSKGLIVLDDIDVVFKEHDKFFWISVEKILSTSRRPVVLTCRDINFIPTNLIEIAQDQGSCFQTKRISQRTVSAFLGKYYKDKGAVVNKPALDIITKLNKNDIRKCLMNLQFYSLPPGTIKVSKIKEPEILDDNIDLLSFSHKADTYSSCDILNTSVNEISLLKDDVDTTLMTSDSITKNRTIIDEQIKLKNDYMIDYKIHLMDDKRYQRKPYELDIVNYLWNQEASTPFFNHSKLLSENKMNLITTSTVAYLSTRVSIRKGNIDSSTRRTRNSNSRKIQEVLEGFSNNQIIDNVDEIIGFDLAITNKKDIQTYINPYVLEIAQAEKIVKEHNRKIFLKGTEGVTREKHAELVSIMSQNRMFKPIWFQADPNIVINSWKD